MQAPTIGPTSSQTAAGGSTVLPFTPDSSQQPVASGVEIVKHSGFKTEDEMKMREKVAKVVVWGLAVLALLAPPVTAVILFWGTASILYGGMVVVPTVVFFGMVAVMIRK